MDLIRPNSLALTVDAVNDRLFFGEQISKSDRVRVAKWIAGRTGMAGSYESMPAPTKKDFSGGLTLYTGEKVTTRAGAAHILGQEACRVLRLLKVDTRQVHEVLETADLRMRVRIKAGPKWPVTSGMYCCATCSCALWRHIAEGGMHWCKGMVRSGLRTLMERRDGKGRWRGFPFYYTLLVLTEVVAVGAAGVRVELRYALAACERADGRIKGKDILSQRRREVIRRARQRA